LERPDVYRVLLDGKTITAIHPMESGDFEAQVRNKFGADRVGTISKLIIKSENNPNV